MQTSSSVLWIKTGWKPGPSDVNTLLRKTSPATIGDLLSNLHWQFQPFSWARKCYHLAGLCPTLSWGTLSWTCCPMTPWPFFVRSPSPGTMLLPAGPQSNLLIHILVFGPLSYLMVSSCRPVKGNTGRATEPVSRLSVDISSIFESVRI